MSFYSDFAEYYEQVFPVEAAVDAFLKKRMPERGRVLDVGCGTGDYCGSLGETGRDSVGIDADPRMIATAQERYPGVEFRTMDMTDVGMLGGHLDGAFCIGNVASHVGRLEFETFVEDLAALMSPGAPWILQFVNWDYLLTRSSHRFPDVTIAGGDIVFERRYPNISPEEAEFATRLVRGEDVLFEGSVTLHPLTFEDCIRVHDERGFALAESMGSFRGSEFEPGVMSASIHTFARI
ncbi:class I SAM-dependent methyltransferase [bacterium]|nr:class I SAM-dependent methyltransferase [bacterium]